jgi:hypothetical protein
VLHVCDATYSGNGKLLDFKPLGDGDVEIARQVELLKGIVFNGYIIFEWPKVRVDSLAPPAVALPAAATFLRECIESEQPILTAYKGDKHPAKMASRVAS